MLSSILGYISLNLTWISLVLATILTLLFIIITRLAYLSKQRAHFLATANENLKKEIAERIQAEESNKKLQKALLQGQKLQAIGTLAGGIAHDFNNIIYAIRGYVEMSQEDVETNSIVYHNLGKVLEATQRAQELIARILAFSRRQRYEFKSLCIEHILENVLGLLRPTIPASVTLAVTKSTEQHYIMGNETQLHQVIVNLINNAVDAMEGEGTITIQLTNIAGNDKLLQQFPEQHYESYCRIDVADTGNGMDQHTMERIFEPFFTTKEVGKGTGLGLSTAHAIIKEHHGEIIVDSQIGKGTVFSILIPTTESKSPLLCE